MQRTLALLGGLAALAGGLGLYAYYGVMKADEAETARKDLEEHVFAPHSAGAKGSDGGAPAGAVFTKITVTAKGQTTVLEQNAGAWAITSPVKASADKLAVDGLVSQLQTAKVKALVDDSPDEAALATYGLKEPQFTVTAEAFLPEGPRQVALLGGIENTFDGSVYLQRKGEKQVYSAEGGLRWALEKSTYDLREKELFSFDEPKLKALEVKARVNSYRLERDEQKSWQLLRPIAVAADAPTLAAMVGALKSERALSFPEDTPAARQGFGLEAPLCDATFTLQSGETVRLRLSSGAADAGEKTYALREGPGDQVVLAEISPAGASVLDKNPSDLKDKTVLAFRREEVARITFRSAGGAEVSVQKKPAPEDGGPSDDWLVLSPTPGPAKKWKLSSVLWTLGTLKVGQFGEEKPKDWARYGLDAKSRQVMLADAAGNELGRLIIGKAVADPPGFVWVRGTRAQVLAIDSARLADLPQSLADVLDAQDAGTP